MKPVVIVLAMLFLGACCKPDPGDSTSPGKYWDGCWAVWKEGSGQEAVLFPTAK